MVESPPLVTPDLKEGVVSVVSYMLERHPEYIEISYCIDTEALYDYILLKIYDYIDGLVEMYEYRLIGNPDLFGTVTKWTPTTGWYEDEEQEYQRFYDIRDCYSIVCQYRDNGWKLLAAEE